jgi:TRAP-type C4-dicarboxylate transport system substrate-binding protein
MNHNLQRKVAIAAASAGLLVATGCAQGPNQADDGTSIAAGATQAEYVEAMKDLEPITVTMQSLSPQGSVDSRGMEEYAAALDEWSGGKIQAEIAYSSSIAPLTETAEALADGRIDFTRHAPLYEPDEYPETNALVDLTFVGERTPVVGRLQRFGAYSQTGLEHEPIVKEMEEHGLQPAIPLFMVTPNTVLACKDGAATSLSEMSGLRARASGPVHVKQLETVGITPSDLDIAEIYEGLQRGVIDCGEMSLSTLKIVGAMDIAKHVSYAEDTGFSDVPGAFSFGRGFWEDTPLVARQLMWDRLDVFVEETIRTAIATEAEVLQTMVDNGGSVESWDADASAKMADFNEGLLETARSENGELVTALESNTDSWLQVVTEDLGYEDQGTYADLPKWFDESQIDLGPFVEEFSANVLEPHRPE